jgi:hypothetical protein
MSLASRAKSAITAFINKPQISLSANTVTDTGMPLKQGKYLTHDLKSVSQARKDIKDMQRARSLYFGQDPKTYALQLLMTDIFNDEILTSQKENRTQHVHARDIRLKKPNGEVDTAQTEALKKMPIRRFLTEQILDAIYFEYSVCELSMNQTIDGTTYLVGDVTPRTNIVPQTGVFWPDYTNPTGGIKYREMDEYGVWILEFWTKKPPLFNKAIPAVLFSRFALSCHSELCEIYGIPPRWLKTNTQDKNMMDRAKKMMGDMGAASWFIIDEDEEFGFAETAATSGDVYTNLIHTCDNRKCLLITGGILAQDTKNGNRAKDQVAKDLLALLVESDIAWVEECWNYTIIPCLKKHGILKGDLTFEYVPVVDKKELFERAIAALEYYGIDQDWFAETFGLNITSVRENPIPSNKTKSKSDSNLKAKAFFD